MREYSNLSVLPGGKGRLFEQVRRIGLAGEALVQLRADYERNPNALVREAIRRKIGEIVELGAALEDEEPSEEELCDRTLCSRGGMR